MVLVAGKKPIRETNYQKERERREGEVERNFFGGGAAFKTTESYGHL